jgi:glycosyltransferase involved in cell wall biosynthesis
MRKLFRTSTVALSLDLLLKGQLHFLSQHYEVTAVSGEDAHLKNVREREQVTTCNISMKRPISLWKDLISLYKLYRLFKVKKPDIVHSITPKAGLLTMTAARLAGVPIRIHTFTGLIFPSKRGIFKRILMLMDKFLCCMATDVYPEGNGVRNDLIQNNITNKPLRVLGNGNVNGVDLNYYNLLKISDNEKEALRLTLKIMPTDFVFVFVGRLVADKGIHELVAAFEKIAAHNKQVKLLLVGPFEADRDPLQVKTLYEINHNPHIISVGFQQDVRPYLAISNVMIFPSYREGFPNVLLQAGAMRLPAIVTNINGSNEIITHGINGLVIPARDPEAIVTSMNYLLEQPHVCKDMAASAYELVKNKFDQQFVWQSLLMEYKQLEAKRLRNVL